MSYLPWKVQTMLDTAKAGYYEAQESGGGMSQATASAMRAVAESDCNIIDGGEDRVRACYADTAWNQLSGFIDLAATALQNLSDPRGSKYYYKVQLKVYKRASKDAKKVAKAGYKVLKTCLRQDPRNVCSRQKSMQMMWAAAPDTMKSVSDVFASGFDAKTKQKALEVMEKGGMPASNAEFVTEWFKNDGSPGSATSAGGNPAVTYSDIASAPAPKTSGRSQNANDAVSEIAGLPPAVFLAFGAAAIFIVMR